MQPLGLHTSVDGTPAEPELEQLIPSHHPVLPIGELGKGPIPANAPFFIYFMVNGAFVAHRPHRCCRSLTRGALGVTSLPRALR
jgi:hypothetical protein